MVGCEVLVRGGHVIAWSAIGACSGERLWCSVSELGGHCTVWMPQVLYPHLLDPPYCSCQVAVLLLVQALSLSVLQDLDTQDPSTLTHGNASSLDAFNTWTAKDQQ